MEAIKLFLPDGTTLDFKSKTVSFLKEGLVHFVDDKGVTYRTTLPLLVSTEHDTTR